MDSPLDNKLDIPLTTDWMTTESINDWIDKATQSMQDLKRKAVQDADTSKRIHHSNDKPCINFKM